MFFMVSVVAVLFGVSQAREFQFLNKMNLEIWVGIQGNPGHGNLHNGGFVLPPGQQISIISGDEWAGRFWGRTGCDPFTNYCETGNCMSYLECAGIGGSPPVTVAEIQLKGDRALDIYSISVVSGFNIPLLVQPLGRNGDNPYSCTIAQCHANLYGDCPEEMIVSMEGRIIGCNSACLAFSTKKYCCRNARNPPESCKKSVVIDKFTRYFKEHCPDAYSYVNDDHNATYTCLDPPTYRIQFGL